MQGLSGGQSARVGLAGLLLSRFDAYLLDEPTNDLDLDGLELLEQFLAGVRGPVILVSHDREFLARRITRVLDFDPALEAVGDYRGGFDAYVAERAPARGRAQADYDAVAATREDLQAQMRAARATSDRGAKVARAKHRCRQHRQDAARRHDRRRDRGGLVGRAGSSARSSACPRSSNPGASGSCASGWPRSSARATSWRRCGVRRPCAAASGWARSTCRSTAATAW